MSITTRSADGGTQPSSKTASTKKSTGAPAARHVPQPARSNKTNRASSTAFDKSILLKPKNGEDKPDLTAAIKKNAAAEKATPTDGVEKDGVEKGTGTNEKGAKKKVAGAKGTKAKDAEEKGAATNAGNEQPSASDQVVDDAKAARGKKTSNDGRADRGLRHTNNVGARDRKIKELKDEQKQLSDQEKEIQGKIDDTSKTVDGKENTSNVVKTVTDVVTNVASPAITIFKMITGSNPVADAAKHVTDAATGVEKDRKQLESERNALADKRRTIEKQLTALQNERVLNFVSDTAHVTKMDAAAKELEGDGDVRYEVQDETQTHTDAAYRTGEKTIVLGAETVKSAGETMKELQDKGAVDEDGNVTNADVLDASEAGDKAIGAAALWGVHEPTHLSQDTEGKIEAAEQNRQKVMAEAQQVSRNMGPEDREAVLAAARKRAEMERIDALEYDAYTNQETTELQAGKQKKLFTTIRSDGTPLSRKEAVENIYALQTGQAMVHGESAGLSVADVTGEDHHDHDHDHDEHGGDQETPGRFTGGDQSPGRFTGGDQSPGRFTGGDQTPGRFTGGDQTPGRFTGGDQTPGRFTGGDLTPGRFTGGNETPGRFTGGDLTPGRFTGGNETPGRFTGGNQTPGRFTG